MCLWNAPRNQPGGSPGPERPLEPRTGRKPYAQIETEAKGLEQRLQAARRKDGEAQPRRSEAGRNTAVICLASIQSRPGEPETGRSRSGKRYLTPNSYNCLAAAA